MLFLDVSRIYYEKASIADLSAINSLLISSSNLLITRINTAL
jgi:hypothetical protein